jgi:hypothetical protein
VPSYTSRAARLLFMLEAHDPQGTIGYMVVSEPISIRSEVRSHRTLGSARSHLYWEIRSGAIEHVAASSPPHPRGEV